MNLPTILVIVRLYDPYGNMVANADVTAKLSSAMTYQGYVVPEQIEGVTNEFGHCLLRLWPNAFGSQPSNYKFTMVNPDSGQRKIVYASLPKHDVFLDEIASPNEGDWLDGGIGMPDGSGGGSGPGTVISSTVTAGTTTTGAPGTAAQVINRGTPTERVLDFIVPAGRDGLPGANGLNGTGTIVAGETITGAPGTPAMVRNVGTEERAVLEFTIPQGIPGTSNGSGTGGGALPPGGTDKQVLTKVGSTDGAAAWRTLTFVTDTLMGAYLWESSVVTPPTDPDNVFDATTRAAYYAAISEASMGSKRAAAANAVILAMGSAQKLTVKRNGVTVLVADYTGAMTQTSNGTNIGVALSGNFTVGPIAAADVTTGTWTCEITGGTGFARKITLPLATDVSTTPGNGFNPTVNLIIPRSVDGL